MNDFTFPAWYRAVEGCLLLFAAAIGAVALGTVMFGKDVRASIAEETRATLAAAHADACTQLHVAQGPDFTNCIKVMAAVQARHDQINDARNAPY
jgi:hypothetical protein